MDSQSTTFCQSAKNHPRMQVAWVCGSVFTGQHDGHNPLGDTVIGWVR